MGGICFIPKKDDCSELSANHNRSVNSSSEIGEQIIERSRPPLHPTSIITTGPNNVQNELHLELPPSLTASPRIIEDGGMRSCIIDTPIGDKKTLYKYYCPICMKHFRQIFSVKCCNNYICLECSIEFLGSKGLQASSSGQIVSNPIEFQSIPCPHCNSSGFSPKQGTCCVSSLFYQ